MPNTSIVKKRTIKVWATEKKDKFTRWFNSDWDIKDWFAWIGFCSALGMVVGGTIRFIRFIAKNKKN